MFAAAWICSRKARARRFWTTAHPPQPVGNLHLSYVRAVNGLVLDDTACGAGLEREREAQKMAERLKAAKPTAAANALFAEIEANKHKAEQAKQEAVLNAETTFLNRLKAQGVRILAIEHCRTPEEAAMARCKTAARESLAAILVDPSRRLDSIDGARAIHENADPVLSLGPARTVMAVLDSQRFNSREMFVEALGLTNHDLLIIDGFHRKRESLTFDEIRRLQFKRVGTRRVVLARLNLTLAEAERFYWKPAWRIGRPQWLEAPGQDGTVAGSLLAPGVEGHSGRLHARACGSGG